MVVCKRDASAEPAALPAVPGLVVVPCGADVELGGGPQAWMQQGEERPQLHPVEIHIQRPAFLRCFTIHADGGAGGHGKAAPQCASTTVPGQGQRTRVCSGADTQVERGAPQRSPQVPLGVVDHAVGIGRGFTGGQPVGRGEAELRQHEIRLPSQGAPRPDPGVTRSQNKPLDVQLLPQLRIQLQIAVR